MLREEFPEEAGNLSLRLRLVNLLGLAGNRGGLEEFVELEESAAKSGAIGGPFVVARGTGQSYADSGQLGVEVVEVVEDHGFANHGQFGGAEFILAVMANEQMLHDGFQRDGKAGDF